MNIKGSLPLIILQILSQSPKHGYGIAKEIKGQSGGTIEISEGTLYPTLHDLEKRGFITAEEQEVKGRMRRYYRLTEAGSGELAKERAEWGRYAAGVNMILGEASS